MHPWQILKNIAIILKKLTTVILPFTSHKQLVYKQLALDGELLSNFQGSTLFH